MNEASALALLGPVDSTRSVIAPVCLTVRDSARVSGLSESKIWALIRGGDLEVSRVGRRTLVRFDSLKRLLGIAA